MVLFWGEFLCTVLFVTNFVLHSNLFLTFIKYAVCISHDLDIWIYIYVNESYFVILFSDSVCIKPSIIQMQLVVFFCGFYFWGGGGWIVKIEPIVIPVNVNHFKVTWAEARPFNLLTDVLYNIKLSKFSSLQNHWNQFHKNNSLGKKYVNE